MTGSELRQWRKQHHLTQVALGQLLGGLSKYVISYMEHDRTIVHPSIALLLWAMGNASVRAAVATKQGVAIPTS